MLSLILLFIHIQFLGIRNKAAMHTCVHVFVWMCAFLLDTFLGMDWLDHVIGVKQYHTSGCYLRSHQRCVKVPALAHPY